MKKFLLGIIIVAALGSLGLSEARAGGECFCGNVADFQAFKTCVSNKRELIVLSRNITINESMDIEYLVANPLQITTVGGLQVSIVVDSPLNGPPTRVALKNVNVEGVTAEVKKGTLDVMDGKLADLLVSEGGFVMFRGSAQQMLELPFEGAGPRPNEVRRIVVAGDAVMYDIKIQDQAIFASDVDHLGISRAEAVFTSQKPLVVPRAKGLSIAFSNFILSGEETFQFLDPEGHSSRVLLGPLNIYRAAEGTSITLDKIFKAHEKTGMGSLAVPRIKYLGYDTDNFKIKIENNFSKNSWEAVQCGADAVGMIPGVTFELYKIEKGELGITKISSVGWALDYVEEGEDRYIQFPRNVGQESLQRSAELMRRMLGPEVPKMIPFAALRGDESIAVLVHCREVSTSKFSNAEDLKVCEEGHSYDGNECVMPCQADAACPNGESCQGGECLPIAPIFPAPCAKDADCANGETCDLAQGFCTSVVPQPPAAGSSGGCSLIR